MSDTSDILADGFNVLWADNGSKTVTYAGQTINAVWQTRQRGLSIEEGPKAVEDAWRVTTIESDWTTIPTEGKLVTKTDTSDQLRVVHRAFSGGLVTFTLANKSQ